ncbi:MAG: deoxynucleoside kinase [Gammaproteobacteria bacterium]|nr:deoxynucleoside kinase [Gammaproteobacteria bacterium]
MTLSEKFNQDIPRYIAIEGPIGVGKTSLTKRLAKSFNYELLLERGDENPFLERFYQNPKQHALSTQLFFLFQRAQQIHQLKQDDMFQPVRIADFLIEKDQLFAQQTLDPDEYTLYLNIYNHLTINAPAPNLVIYLQAPTKVLLNRIQKRGILSEQFIELGYLENLNHAYTEFFHYYDKSPLLIINNTEIDLINNEKDYNQLVDYIVSHPTGTNYFNPG